LKGNGPKPDGSEEMVARFVGLMEERRWIYELPSAALECHYFEDRAATQVTSSGSGWSAGVQPELIKEEKRPRLDIYEDKENNGKRKRALAENKNNGNVKRQPAKKICGNKPFKVPQMSVLTDIFNEALY
jgi:hypothetical protein